MYLRNKFLSYDILKNEEKELEVDRIVTYLNGVRVSLTIEKHGEKEFIYVNGYGTLKIISNSSNAFYIESGDMYV